MSFGRKRAPQNQSSVDGMSSPHDPQQVIEAERAAYLDELPGPELDCPPDVGAVYRVVLSRLFDWEIQAQDVVEDCGIGSHDIYSRFRRVTRYGIKEFVVHHRIQLAKRLLRYELLSVTQVAFAVGYDSPGGFCATFKRRVGQTPTVFRKQREE